MTPCPSDARGVDALHYNPAGLGYVTRGQIQAAYQSMVLDVEQGGLGYVHPLKEGAWGVSLNYLNYGSTTRTTIINTGGVITGNGNAGTFSGHDFAAGISYGRKITDWSWGVTGKYVSSRIDNVSAGALAVDAGVQWAAPSLPLNVGVAMKNLGTNMKYDAVREELPLLGRIGAEMSFLERRLRLKGDVEFTRHEKIRALAGVEYWIVDIIALRAGYDGRSEIDDGITAGAGFRWENLALDYAYLPSGHAGNNHRVSLKFDFAGSSPAK